MQLIVLNDDFQTLGTIPLFRTLIWTRRYESPGCFELHVSREYFSLLNSGRYLYRNDADELGVIDEINYAQDDNGTVEVYAKGNFAEILLQNRVIDETYSLSGNIEEAMRHLVDKTSITPSDKTRSIRNLRLGNVNNVAGTLNCQITGDNLSEKLYEIGNANEISHRVRYDYIANDLLFEVWQGVDRRDSQAENSWAIFSNSFVNIKNVIYNRNTASFKNYAYVAGEGEGKSRIIITVDIRNNNLEERREIWVDARDLQRETDGETMSMDTYLNALRQRGKEKLAEYRKLETVNSGIDPNANLVYKKDFDLGDLCTYINTDINIATDKRITEIMETYEGGAMTLDITFGTDDVSTIRQLIKREVK